MPDGTPPHAMYAASLSDVFEKATNLVSFNFGPSGETLFICAPRIAAAMADHPPSSLSLEGLGPKALQALRPIRGLRSLNLSVDWHSVGDPSCGTDVSELILNSTDTLVALSLEGITPEYLYAWSKTEIRPCLALTYLSVTRMTTTLEHLDSAFPNLQSLHIFSIEIPSLSEAELSSSALPRSTLWPHLMSLETESPGLVPLITRLNHTLRRIDISDQITFDHTFTQLFDSIHNCPILSLQLLPAIELVPQAEGPGGMNGALFFSQLAKAVPHLQMLRLSPIINAEAVDGATELADITEFITSPTIDVLATLKDIKFVSISMLVFSGRMHSLPKHYNIIQEWFEILPSLEYFELQAQTRGWERTWWRRPRAGERCPGGVAIASAEEGEAWCRQTGL